MRKDKDQRETRSFDVTIQPILFTQGIDMVQTMSNAKRSGFQVSFSDGDNNISAKNNTNGVSINVIFLKTLILQPQTLIFRPG